MSNEEQQWCATTRVALLSSVHGEQRRRERNLGKRDLQAAVKHGTRETQYRKNGDVRLKYTFADVVYITDITSTREITSYAVQMPLPRVEVPPRDEEQIQEAKKRSNITAHIILVVDQSGSMNKSDVDGHRSRSRAVYYTIANEFIAALLLQLHMCRSMVVTLIEMREQSVINPEIYMEPISWTLYNKFVSLAEEPLRGRSHGNYLPAIDLVEQLVIRTHKGVSLMLFILSDGRPSDISNRLVSSSFDLQIKLQERLASIFQQFKDQLTFGAFGFGSSKDDFSVLKFLQQLAGNRGVKNSFFDSGLNAKTLRQNLSVLMTSLTVTMTGLSSIRGITKTQKETRKGLVKDNNVEMIDPLSSLVCNNEWKTLFSHDRHLKRVELARYTKGSRVDKWKQVELLHPSARGIAIKNVFFGRGAERVVYEMTEVDVHGKPVGGMMCAKIDPYSEEQGKQLQFHERFGETQRLAGKYARQFNQRLGLLKVHPSVPRIQFLECFYYTYDVDQLFEDGVLCEKKLNGEWMKWNDNKGGIWNVSAAQVGHLSSVQEACEEEEELGDEEELEEEVHEAGFKNELTYNEKQLNKKIMDDDVPQAFSHYTYKFSNRKHLVVDLQGVLSTDEHSPVFQLTDPVIHAEKRWYGPTNFGRKGVSLFFQTHKCNPLCELMGLFAN